MESSTMEIKEFIIDNEKISVEILEQQAMYFKLKINNKIFEITVEYWNSNEQILNLIINQQPFKIKYSEETNFSTEKLLIYIIKYCQEILIQKTRKGQIDHISKPSSSKFKQNVFDNFLVKSPLSGRIVKILIKTGELVEKNQPLLIIESMKMENEIRSPCKAYVKNIQIKQNDLVQQNQVLIELKQ